MFDFNFHEDVYETSEYVLIDQEVINVDPKSFIIDKLHLFIAFQITTFHSGRDHSYAVQHLVLVPLYRHQGSAMDAEEPSQH